MARAPRVKKADKAPENVQALIEALEFVSVAQRDEGTFEQTHCRLGYGTVSAFNGITAAGIVAKHELMSCPHTGRFLAALKKCKADASITNTPSMNIAIHAGPLKVIVPAVDPDTIPFVEPDKAIAPFTQAVVDALNIVGELATEGAQRVVMASVFLKKNTAVGTNSHVALEAWHGVDLPELVIPKSFLIALKKCGKEPTMFGFSERSLTVWFGETAWLRTQLYNEQYPDTDRVLKFEGVYHPAPPGLFEAANELAPFVEGIEALYFGEGIARTVQWSESTNPEGNPAGASFAFEGAPAGFAFKASYLRLVAPYAAQIGFARPLGHGSSPPTMHFHNDAVRGVVAAIGNAAP